MGPDAMIFVFWMLNFNPAFSLFSFIKRLFTSSLSALSMVSSAYLRLLIFLPVILIPACNSSSLARHLMCSVYKLNKQGDRNSLVAHKFNLCTCWIVAMKNKLLFHFYLLTLQLDSILLEYTAPFLFLPEQSVLLTLVFTWPACSPGLPLLLVKRY